MTHNKPIMRALTVLFAAILFGGLTAKAEKKSWVKIDGTTMTFLYGEKGTLAENEYELNNGENEPAWRGKRFEITKVAFDASFKDARPTSCYMWFNNFNNITTIEGMENLNTSEVTTMSSMFSGCDDLEDLDLSHFDTRKVTDMSFMFALSYSLGRLDLSSFDTQNVTDMRMMFFASNVQHIFVSDKFTTTKVEESAEMFLSCDMLSGAIPYNYDFDDHTFANTKTGYFTDVKLKDEAKYYWTKYADKTVTFCYGKKNSLGENEAFVKVMDGSQTPHQDEVETAVIDESFREARPASCRRWFERYENLTEIKGMENFNTSEMESMAFMFYKCKSLKSIDLSHFDTSKVKNMRDMFGFCHLLQSLDLSQFNTSNVEDMNGMFEACYSLPYIDISNFNTSKVTDMADMFNYCTSARYIFVDNQLKMDNVEDSENMFNFCISLTGAIDFDDDKTDGAYANTESGYLTDIKNKDQAKYIWAKHTDDTFTLYFGKKDKLEENEEYMPANYRDIPLYTSSMKKVVFDKSFKDARPASCCGYFAGFSNLTDIEGLEYLNTSKARDFNYMFYDCQKLQSLDLSRFNTSAATLMTYMFYNCNNLKKVYLGEEFSTEKVTSNENMFYNSDPAIYCHPEDYAAIKASWCLDGRSFRAYVNRNAAAEYATLCVPQGSDLTTGTFSGFDKIYSVVDCKTGNDGYALLKEEQHLEPGKAYIYHRDISATDNAIAEIAYEPNANAATEPMTDGLLRGVFAPTIAPTGCYFLEKDALFHLMPSDGVNVVYPYYAYLQSATGSALPSTLSLQFETDDIKDVSADSDAALSNGIVYDLMGRRVSTLVKGNVYIRNGKKIIR